MFRKKIPEISVQELKNRIESDNNLIILDIRKPREWVETGIIPGSELITDEAVIKGIDFGKLGDKFVNKDVVFVCRSGNRSEKMTSFLINHRDLKARKIINMKGGILAWKDKGYQVISPVR